MAQKNGGKKTTPPAEAPKQRPAHEVRFGKLKATIWRQESDKGPWYSVVLTRGYQDAQGNWHSASSFGRDDLLLVAKLCDQAHSWIHGQTAKDAPAAGGAGSQAQPQGSGEAGQDDVPF